MGSIGCCFLWLLGGVILGWLLNYWLCKRCCKKSKENTQSAPPPIAKAADVPATTAAAQKKAPAKTSTTKPKAAAKPKATTAKPKAKTKPKTAAKATASKTTIDLAAAKAAGIKIKSANDLTVIEGIGPKINDLFKDNGLKTFAQVGDATVTQMRAVLDKGGARYRIANPGTWAKQAKLAANNKWTALKKLQDELSGGKKK